jgi:cyclase
MEQVTEGVFAETNIFGCNPGFIVTDDGVVMVDTPQKPSIWPGWKEAVAEHGPVRWIINTEPHWDHTMGNPFFEGPIVAHDETLRNFHNVSPLWGFGIDGVGQWIAKADPEGVSIAGDYKPREPEITFSHDMTLYVGEIEIQLLHTPGHTKGETAVYLPDRGVLFATDNLFVDHLIWLQDANPFDCLTSLARIKKLDADRIVPGHGPVCGKEWIGLMEEKIEEILVRVRNAIAQGRTEDETAESVKYRDLCVLDDDYKDVHDKVEGVSVRMVYRFLKENE